MSCSKDTPKTSLEKLEKGNKRYVYEETLDERRDSSRRLEVSKAQAPFAAVLTCSDSRVVAELIFDQGIGDLFVVRTAGNVVGSIEKESLLFAVEVLKAPIILILGHQNCGAVHGVLEDGDALELLPDIAELIKPAVDEAQGEGADRLRSAININARNMALVLKNDPRFAKLIKEGVLDIRAGYYDFNTGKVIFFDPILND